MRGVLDACDLGVLEFPLEPRNKTDDEEYEALWRHTPVTLCIAAACQYRNQPRIATCTDWKASSSLGSAETADKLRWLKAPNWIALTAGDAAKAEALVRTYRGGLKDREITEANAHGFFSTIAIGHLMWLKNCYVRQKHGVSWKHFLEKGKKQFPESVLLNTHMQVEAIDLGASLIVAGFIKHGTTMKPLICKVSRSGAVSISDHFEAIGEGLYVASPPLLQRQYDSNVSLIDAVYRLFEAKTLAEIVPSVGKDTSIDILYPTGELEQVSDRGYDMLESMFRKYGPKRNIKQPKMAGKYFDGLDFSRLR